MPKNNFVVLKGLTSHYMRPKVLFLVFHGFDAHNGISKKIWGQVRGLQQCGTDTRLCYYQVDADGCRGWMVDDSQLVNFGAGTWAKIRKRIDYRAILHYADHEKISLVYIRSDHNANPLTIGLVKALRKAGSRVVMEIPTYPYDREYDGHPQRRKLLIDRLFRRSLAQQLDAIVTFSEEKDIFGQKTIRISNGVDFGALPLRDHQPQKDGTIHLLAVAEIHYWHGFDRLIEGLAIYNRLQNETRVVFHLVGGLTGSRERAEILKPMAQHGLSGQVQLHGPLCGRELDQLFDLADLAIGSLGRHRSGIDIIRTLKNREYAARGIPFVYSESDPDFDHREYVLKVAADESPIDIASLLTFVRSLSSTPEYIRNSIGGLSWKAQMRNVLSAIFPRTDDLLKQ